MARDQSAVLPATVRVHFTPWPCGTAVSFADLPTEFHLDSALADAAEDLGIEAQGVATIRSFRDPCHAIFAAKGADPTNKAALRALADRIARDFWAWRTVAFDRRYNGVAVPTPDGTVDAIRWAYREGDASTRLWSVPIGGEPAVLAHADPADDCDAGPKVYGGHDRATVANGVLTLPKQKLAVVAGVLRWYKLAPEAVTLCPAGDAGPAVMTTEDGTTTTTEGP